MFRIRSRRFSAKHLAFQALAFAAVYFVVFTALLWAGTRTFPGQDAMPSEGADLYLDLIATQIVYTVFTPFHLLGYEFTKFLGPTLWYVAAGIWSVLLTLPYLAIRAIRKNARAHPAGSRAVLLAPGGEDAANANE